VQLQVKGRNVSVTDGLRGHAESKLEKLDRKLPEVARAELELRVERNPRRAGESQVAEITIWTAGPILRAREANADMYVAIDRAIDKLARQAQRYQQRRVSRRHDGTLANAPQPAEALPPMPADAVASLDGRIVRTKEFDLRPMTPDEAALQMELIGHDFFVFSNVEEGNRTTVVYRRVDGDYGVIQPTG
jgi:putative sigma-54 modulation protein